MKTPETDELENVAKMGRLGFPASKVAQYLTCEDGKVEAQFRARKGEVYEAYVRGRLQGEVELRETIMKAALNSSTPALERMLQFLGESAKENLEIWE